MQTENTTQKQLTIFLGSCRGQTAADKHGFQSKSLCFFWQNQGERSPQPSVMASVPKRWAAQVASHAQHHCTEANLQDFIWTNSLLCTLALRCILWNVLVLKPYKTRVAGDKLYCMAVGRSFFPNYLCSNYSARCTSKGLELPFCQQPACAGGWNRGGMKGLRYDLLHAPPWIPLVLKSP